MTYLYLFGREKQALRAKLVSVGLGVALAAASTPTIAKETVESQAQVAFGVSVGIGLLSQCAAARARHKAAQQAGQDSDDKFIARHRKPGSSSSDDDDSNGSDKYSHQNANLPDPYTRVHAKLHNDGDDSSSNNNSNSDKSNNAQDNHFHSADYGSRNNNDYGVRHKSTDVANNSTPKSVNVNGANVHPNNSVRLGGRDVNTDSPKIGQGRSSNSALDRYRVSGSVNPHDRSLTSDQQKEQAIDEFNSGTELLRAGNYEAAIKSFQEALACDPDLVEAHWNEAVAYESMKDYQSCLDQLKPVISNDKSSSDCLFLAADAAQHLKKYDEAKHYYEEYLAVNTNRNNSEIARRSLSIIDNCILHQARGDYFSDATRERVAHWPNSNMPLKVYLMEDDRIKGYKPEYCTALKDAFQQWTDISDGKIQFEFTDKKSKANIVCAWTDDAHDMAGGNELGLTQTRVRSGGVIESATILFLTVYAEKLSKDEKFAKQKVVYLHEIGHALGLEHSKQPYDIMYPEVCPSGLEICLNDRDRNTILELYSRHISSGICSSGLPFVVRW
jgi:tetratricopeptide (TPR) repeat protein